MRWAWRASAPGFRGRAHYGCPGFMCEPGRASPLYSRGESHATHRRLKKLAATGRRIGPDRCRHCPGRGGVPDLDGRRTRDCFESLRCLPALPIEAASRGSRHVAHTQRGSAWWRLPAADTDLPGDCKSNTSHEALGELSAFNLDRLKRRCDIDVQVFERRDAHTEVAALGTVQIAPKAYTRSR